MESSPPTVVTDSKPQARARVAVPSMHGPRIAVAQALGLARPPAPCPPAPAPASQPRRSSGWTVPHAATPRARPRWSHPRAPSSCGPCTATPCACACCPPRSCPRPPRAATPARAAGRQVTTKACCAHCATCHQQPPPPVEWSQQPHHAPRQPAPVLVFVPKAPPSCLSNDHTPSTMANASPHPPPGPRRSRARCAPSCGPCR